MCPLIYLFQKVRQEAEPVGFLGRFMSKCVNSILSFSCTCCGRSIVKPAFIGGKPYGQDCAKKIKGAAFGKSKAVFVKAEQVSIDMENYLPSAAYEIEGVPPQKFKITTPFPAHVIAQKRGVLGRLSPQECCHGDKS